MGKFKHLDKHLEKKGLKVKEKVKIDKPFNTLPTKDKDALLERTAIDLGYMEVPAEEVAEPAGDENQKKK